MMNVLRIHELLQTTGLSRTTVWRLEQQGRFPLRIRLGQKSVGWREDEVLEWIASRPRGVSASTFGENDHECQR